MIGKRLKDNMETLLKGQVSTTTRLHGGDLSQVFRLVLTDGRSCVAKLGPLVDREAYMLREIAATGALAPAVIGQADGLLLLQDLQETTATPMGWRALGNALRKLHRPTKAPYGWSQDYAFAAQQIRNIPDENWPEFWARNRLLDALATLPRDLPPRLEKLSHALPNLLPAAPSPALLHGDLWSGNVLFAGDQAWLIDPASYVGHGEVDLAMLTLFGAPHPDFDAAYGPVEPGWRARRLIYQLWPALMHLRLFGASYHAMVSEKLTRLGF